MFVYICIAIGDLIFKKGRIGIPLIGHKLSPVFSSADVVYFVINDSKGELVVRFVNEVKR